MPSSVRAGSVRTGSRKGSISSQFTHIPPENSFYDRPPTATDFPPPSSHANRDRGLISPAVSTFSFTDPDGPVHAISTPPSPQSSPTRTYSMDKDDTEKRLMSRNMGRGAYMDGFSSSGSRTPQEREVAKRKSQYYGDAFAYRDLNLTPRDRVHQDSIITVEVKTNVIIKDEYVFLDELAQHLSQRYQRPTSSVFITLDHSACLLFAGTFDSAYILTVTALESQLLPTVNKRNTALIQSHMTTSLGVFPDRGIVRFLALSDEYLSTGGTTYLGHTERIQKAQDAANGVQSDTPSLHHTLSRRHRRKSLNIKSTAPPTVAQRLIKSSAPSRVGSPPSVSPPMPGTAWENGTSPNRNESSSAVDRKAEKAQKLGKRKSFFAIFSR